MNSFGSDEGFVVLMGPDCWGIFWRCLVLLGEGNVLKAIPMDCLLVAARSASRGVRTLQPEDLSGASRSFSDRLSSSGARANVLGGTSAGSNGERDFDFEK